MPYSRESLDAYGVLPEHTHVALFTKTGDPDAMVLALGTSEAEARAKANELLAEVYKEGHGADGVMTVSEIGD